MAIIRGRVGFARWRCDTPSGGNRYDDELVAGLLALGLDLREYAVSGPWPVPEPHHRQQLIETLTAEQVWLVNNIVGSAAPEAIRMATGAGGRVTMLMHYFPADDPTLPGDDRERLAATEAEAVAAASTIVVTSAWAAREVASRYGRDDAVVATPGIDPVELAPGSSVDGRPPMLLWLSRLTAAKDPLTFVEALASVADLDWTARIVGPDTVEAGLSHQVRDRITQAGLAGRVEVVGPRSGQALESVWARTDLLVHTSRAETYGMVIAEALAHGIPSLVASGTGAVDAHQVGATFPPGQADALAAALREWLTDPPLRARWRAEAADRRVDVPTWAATARIIAAALTGGRPAG